MGAFIAAYGTEILLTLVTAGALAFCRYLWKQVKQYRALLTNQEQDQLEEAIDKKVQPIIEEIEELRLYIRKTESAESEHMKLIISSYKFRLTQLCKVYIRQGYMTQDQYDQLTEFYKLYTALGGNGQAKEYYEKAIKLPIHD